MPSFPGSAASSPAPPPPPLSVPTQTSTPYSMPLPAPPPLAEAEQDTLVLNIGLDMDVEKSTTAPPLEEITEPDQEEGKSSSSLPYEMDIDIDFGMDKKSPSWNDVGEERREGKRRESRMGKEPEDRDEDVEDVPGGGAGNIDTPASPAQQAGQNFKKSINATETTDSPTDCTPTAGPGAVADVGRYNPSPISTTHPNIIPISKRQQQKSQPRQQQPEPPVLSHPPAGDPTVYHPDIGGSSNEIPGLSRYKVIEPQESKLAVQTVDDALRARRRIEDNNVSNPIYIVHQPASSSARERQWRRGYSDDDGLVDEDEDDESEVA
ncbi:hypothetical protein BGZ89_003286 [Linnemannia elongata]|nr:hypothetical protein BGZ89_003286 [Linnemannia elongata]